MYVYPLQTATKRVRGVTDQGYPTPHLKMVGVLGGGLMGSGIATSLAVSGAQVLLKEINPQFMQVRVVVHTARVALWDLRVPARL